MINQIISEEIIEVEAERTFVIFKLIFQETEGPNEDAVMKEVVGCKEDVDFNEGLVDQ
jgi:uncharacterized FlgJ-related protein